MNSIIEKIHPRLKHAFKYAEQLLYEDYYKIITSGEWINQEVYNTTINWFISLEEYEKCAELVKYEKRK